jgi:prefoldin subunit 5
MLAEELTSTMESVVEQELALLKAEDELRNLREEVEKASGQEDDGIEVPVFASEDCQCGGCVRRRTDHTVRQMTPLHGVHVPWGVG